MWYAVQVFTGDEEVVKTLCQQIVSETLLNKCFIPYYERPKRYHGQWHTKRCVLFPGYVFMITDDIYHLYDALYQVPHFTKILGDRACLLPLSPGEEAFLERFGGEEQVAVLSTGVIENQQVRITDGPLTGLEGCIRHIDRHKRIARIQVELFGQLIEATVGLEIVKKV